MFKKVFSFIYIFLCFTVAICNCNAANEVFHGFECNQDRDGKEYLFTDTDLPGRPINNPAIIYRCIFNQSNNSGSWAISPDSILQFCFDDDESAPVHVNPQNFKVGKSISNIRAYINPNINPVPGTTFVYEYTNNKNDMCTWCLQNQYGYYYTSNNEAHIGCFNKEEEAFCAYANDKHGEGTEWKNGKCKCTANNQTWNKEHHICEEEKHGLKCTFNMNGEEYIFLEDGLKIYACYNGKWIIYGDPKWCFSINDFNDVNQTPANTLELKRGDSGYGLYINKNYQPVANKIYKYSDNINNMCMWCDQPTAYPYIDNEGDIQCDTASEELAWCKFAKSKKQQNVTWENGECKCTDDGKEWDKENHTCKSSGSTATNMKCGLECNAPNNKMGIVCVENDVATLFICDGTEWKNEMVWAEKSSSNHCPGESGVLYTVSDKPNMTNLFSDYGGDIARSKNFFINFNLAKSIAIAGTNGAYKIDVDADGTPVFDTNKMCFDCEFGEKGYRKDTNDLACSNWAVCSYAQDNGEKVKWIEDNNEYKCVCVDAHDKPDANKIFDKENHKCKPKTESDKEEEKKEEKKNALTKEKAEAAKKVVQQFVKNTSDKASKWKDVEGNFNTARLASDLTAGVVLGTVGGVVSGVVIKKKQIEKGFEVLHCAIGGQSVAGWGDTFTIGFNR